MVELLIQKLAKGQASQINQLFSSLRMTVPEIPNNTEFVPSCKFFIEKTKKEIHFGVLFESLPVFFLAFW